MAWVSGLKVLGAFIPVGPGAKPEKRERAQWGPPAVPVPWRYVGGLAAGIME